MNAPLRHDLRPYQERALEELRAGTRAGHRRQLLVAPTGAGKTTIASAMAEGAHGRGLHTLAVAHRRELIDQLADRMRRSGLRVGIVQSGRPADLDAPVQVGSIDTLRPRLKKAAAGARVWLPRADLLIVDEAHRVMGDSYQALLEAYPEAHVFGLTATPVRLDGRGLGATFANLVIAAQPRELIELGYLVQPRVFAPPPPAELAGVTSSHGDYSQAQLGAVMGTGKVVGDVVETWLARANGLRTLVFGCTVEHSQKLCDRFRAAGVNAAHVDGETAAGVRAKAFADLEAGRLTVLCNVGIAVEGIDIPSLECVVLARPTQSVTIYLQAVGRVLRPHASKRGCIVLDHGGCQGRHGPPTADRRWALQTTRKAEKEAVPPVYTCRSCWFVTGEPFSACPACGVAREVTAREVREEEGRLAETDAQGCPIECRECRSRRVLTWTPKNGPSYRRASKCEDCGTFLGVVVVQPDEIVKAAEWHRIWAQVAQKGWRPGAAVHRYAAAFPDDAPWRHMTAMQKLALQQAKRTAA